MGSPTKVLFVTGEVEPFASATEIASIVRHLPQRLHETGSFEVRIMMPRYGTISERRNRLHGVIRLCGSSIRMGDKRETLKVKVASIPGIRLQVYFMDNVRFFKRKGMHKDKQGDIFIDNPARSLFFARAVVATLRNLRWKPDVVHALGWISGLLPMLIAEEEKDEELLRGARVIYTPDDVDARAWLSRDLIRKMKILVNGEALGRSLCEVGMQYADATVFPSTVEPNGAIPGAKLSQFSAEWTPMVEQAIALYTG